MMIVVVSRWHVEYQGKEDNEYKISRSDFEDEVQELGDDYQQDIFITAETCSSRYWCDHSSH
jgi:hypothetical protein